MAVETAILNVKSLREQVYDHLREALRRRELRPGDSIRLAGMAEQLGVSRTPLRDALLKLEWEGFVTIHARRGITVRSLSLVEIRHLYELIGALESSLVKSVAWRLEREHLAAMRDHHQRMCEALEADDFARYYRHNLAFHDLPLELSDNHEMLRLIRVQRQRLYDFPRKPVFVKEWEQASTDEHRRYLELLERGDGTGAAAFIRDVHWSFAVQEAFIRRYYAEEIDGER
jgi:DNA-binding GntR family transcriptional regulator